MKAVFVIALSCLVSLNLCEPAKQSLLCDICEFVGEEVDKRVLTDDAKTQVLHLAQEVCTSLPLFSSQCSTAVTEHGQELLDELFAMWDVDMLCSEARLCNSYVEGVFSLGEGEKCRACTDGLDMVKQLISSEDMKDMLHVVVNETCMAIGGDVASCEKLVDTIVDEILGNLLPLFDVQAICAQAGACDSPLAGFQAPSDLECVMCKDAFGILEKVIVSDEVSEMLSLGTIETCKSIGYGEELCLKIGNLLIEALIKNLNAVAEPNYACGALGACPATNTALAVSNDEGCEACMDGLELLDMILKSNDTMALVDIAVNEICLAIGGNVDLCVSMIDGVIDPIIENLIALFDPKSLCIEAGACPKLDGPLLSSPNSPLDDIFCEVCVDGVLELKNIAADHATEEMITELTDILCGAIKIPFCKTVIGSLVKEALQDIGTLNPNVTCIDLGACSNSTYSFSGLGDVCSECTMVADEILKSLESDATQALLKEAISDVCSVVPIPGCKDMLDSVVVQLVDYLKTLDGKAMCSFVGLC